jgi:hypothetical protein
MSTDYCDAYRKGVEDGYEALSDTIEAMIKRQRDNAKTEKARELIDTVLFFIHDSRSLAEYDPPKEPAPDRLAELLKQDAEAVLQDGGTDGATLYHYYAGRRYGSEQCHTTAFHYINHCLMGEISQIVRADKNWRIYDTCAYQTHCKAIPPHAVYYYNDDGEAPVFIPVITYEGQIYNLLFYKKVDHEDPNDNYYWDSPDAIENVTEDYPEAKKITDVLSPLRLALPIPDPEAVKITDEYGDLIYRR